MTRSCTYLAVSATGDTNVNYHIYNNITGSRNVGIFAADLLPGLYFLKVDGMIVAIVSSDSNGIIQSGLTIPSGNHTLEISYCTTATISGQVSYSNLQATSLCGIHVILKDTAGATIANVITSPTGYYYFYQVVPGQYTITLDCPLAPGGYNSSDALLVMKHYVYLTQLSGLFLKAASVRISNVVNSIDAYISREGLINLFLLFQKGIGFLNTRQSPFLEFNPILSISKACVMGMSMDHTCQIISGVQ